jgi:hypothetical protein
VEVERGYFAHAMPIPPLAIQVLMERHIPQELRLSPQAHALVLQDFLLISLLLASKVFLAFEFFPRSTAIPLVGGQLILLPLVSIEQGRVN